jgi:DNA-binding Lrp family transcriptional regulator
MENQHSAPAPRPIDEIDLPLLCTLQVDARAPIGTLSDAAGVSRATAYSRLARLREEGIINALTVTVHPKRVGSASAPWCWSDHLVGFRVGRSCAMCV